MTQDKLPIPSTPKFDMGQRVHVKSVTSRRFEGLIIDRIFDAGDWFYSIDSRNYLHEKMLEVVNE